MNKKHNIYELAERLGRKVWEKNGLKRIYINDGYNTEKMSTTTFIWQDESGEFKVNCYIECPSQPWNWIKSQKEIVISNVEEEVRHALVDFFYMPVRKIDGMVFDNGIMESREEFILYPDVYLSEDNVIKELKKYSENPEEYEIVAISRKDAEKESEKAWYKRKQD